MAVAIWTEEGSSRIQRRHYRPDEVDTSDADAVLDEGDIPDPEERPEWVEATAFYTDAGGFFYEYHDPFEGLDFTDDEKQAVFDAMEQNDLVRMREIIEGALRR